MECTRPCFLVVDREHEGTISDRKLVIESAKFNVLTAYSGVEAIQMLRRFPAVDGVVLNAEMHDMPRESLVGSLREVVPNLKVIVVGRSWNDSSNEDNLWVDALDPEALLAALRKLCPDATRAVRLRNQELR